MASWGSCDYSQLQTLRENVEKLARADMQKFCEDLSRELAARLLALVIPRTPVWKPNEDQRRGFVEVPAGQRVSFTTKSGRVVQFTTKRAVIKRLAVLNHNGGTLRRGWTAKTEEEAGQRGGASSAAAYAQSLEVVKSGEGYQITVINPVQYASYVEFGHRQKPGRYVPQIGKQLKKAWVQGQYMLTISERQLQNWMPGHLEKRLQELLTEVFRADG